MWTEKLIHLFVVFLSKYVISLATTFVLLFGFDMLMVVWRFGTFGRMANAYFSKNAKVSFDALKGVSSLVAVFECTYRSGFVSF